MARPASPTAWGPLEGAARVCVHRHGGQRAAASAPPRLALPRLACAALLSCAAALAACGGGGGGPAAEGPHPGEGLSGGERFSRGEMPTLTVTVGAGDAAGGPDAAGGSVRVGVGEGSPEDVPAGDSVDVAGGNKVMLEAMPERGYRFAGWTLSGGLACASGAQANPCVLPPGQVAAGAAARAFFEAVPAAEAARAAEAAPATSKAVSSPGGSVRLVVADASEGASASGLWIELPGGFLAELRFSAESAATLLASPERGYRFAGWTSGGLACASGARANPCVLPPGQAISDAAARAFFEAVPSTPGVSASPGGSARLVVADPSEGAPASSFWIELPNGFLTELRFSAGSAATLLAFPERGYRFAGWTLLGGLACDSGTSGEDGNPCVLPAGPAIAGAAARAFFEAVPATLTVSAGVGGSVTAEVAGADAVTVGADSSQGLAFGDESSATLSAVPAAGYAFAGWALSGGAACASGARANPCALPPGSATAAAAVGAAFRAVANTLAVSAGAGGSVAASVAGASGPAVRPGGSTAFPFSVESSATLSAMPAAGYAFAGWTLSPPGLACAGGTDANPCALPVGSATADAAVEAAFAAVPSTLTVIAGVGGSVAAEVAGASGPAVRPGGSMAFPFSVESSATLSAVPAAGYAFAGWTLSPPGLACAGRNDSSICVLAEGSATADATVEAAFAAVPNTLTVGAGAGGSVAAEVAGADAVAVGADSSQSLAFSVLSAATLTATADSGYAFAGWALSGQPGLACAGGTDANPCALPPGSATADAAVGAAFEAVPATLTASPALAARWMSSLPAPPSRRSAPAAPWHSPSAPKAATLSAVPDAGYAFAGWTLSGQPGLACAGRNDANPCALAEGSATADATVEAAFRAVATTLTVSAGPNGSVTAEVAGADAVAVGADSSQSLAFSVLSAATLTATADSGYAFAGWALSGQPGLACAGGTDANPCALPPGSATADAAVGAAFEAVPATLTVIAGVGGSVDVVVAGASEAEVRPGGSMAFPFSAESSATLSAVPDAGYAFAGWTLSGQPGLACAGLNDANPCALAEGSATADATVEAAFRAVATMLTVIAGVGGSVDVVVAGASEPAVRPGGSMAFPFSAESSATLSAVPAAGYAFAGWTLSGQPGLACAGRNDANPCALPPGSATAAAAVEAAFAAVATMLTVSAGAGGSVDVVVAGASEGTVAGGSERGFAFSAASSTAALVATPAPGYAFAGWTLSGQPGLACESGTQANPCALLKARSPPARRSRPPSRPSRPR